MTVPLVALAVFAVGLGFLGTPAGPWFQDYLTGEHTSAGLAKLFSWETASIMLLSAFVVGVGVGAGWRLYGQQRPANADEPDPLEKIQPAVFRVLRQKFGVDELYEMSVVRFNAWTAWLSDQMDRRLWNSAVKFVSYLVLGFSWISRFFDEYVVNLGFDKGCRRVRNGGKLMTAWQTGQVQPYLRVIGLALTLLILLLSWGGAK